MGEETVNAILTNLANERDRLMLVLDEVKTSERKLQAENTSLKAKLEVAHAEHDIADQLLADAKAALEESHKLCSLKDDLIFSERREFKAQLTALKAENAALKEAKWSLAGLNAAHEFVQGCGLFTGTDAGKDVFETAVKYGWHFKNERDRLQAENAVLRSELQAAHVKLSSICKNHSNIILPDKGCWICRAMLSEQQLSAAQSALLKEGITIGELRARVTELENEAESETPWDFPDASPTYAELEQQLQAAQAENAALKAEVERLKIDPLCQALTDSDCTCHSCLKDEAIAQMIKTEREHNRLQAALDEAKGLLGDVETQYKSGCFMKTTLRSITAFLAAQGGSK